MKRVATLAVLAIAAMPALSQQDPPQRNPDSKKWANPDVLWQEEKRVARWLHIDLGSAPFATDLTNQQSINQLAVMRIVLRCTNTAQYAQDVDADLHTCEWNQIRPPNGPRTPPD